MDDLAEMHKTLSGARAQKHFERGVLFRQTIRGAVYDEAHVVEPKAGTAKTALATGD